jgi:hypothetical protein
LLVAAAAVHTGQVAGVLAVTGHQLAHQVVALLLNQE